jgi:hypothetical protein
VVFPLICQVNENAKQDLKEGLLLYNTENNVGLKNAWNIIQAEVRLQSVHGVGWGSHSAPVLLGEPPALDTCLDLKGDASMGCCRGGVKRWAHEAHDACLRSGRA